MGKLILARCCDIIIEVLDAVGFVAFEASGYFDDWANDLRGKPKFNLPEIIRALRDSHES